MTSRALRVSTLLFFSGFSALVYQTVWLRQFRLIFGASTYATAAVLAIFMAGLGIGGILLGRRADATEAPLAFYARLELLVALAAAASIPLLWLAAKVYFGSGGSPRLGIAIATLLRLALSVIVLGPATILMGGTLPAAARAAATDDDAGRLSVSLLYGVNTLGAVAGALLSTFVLLETFGNLRTLFIAILINALVGVSARAMARGIETSAASIELPVTATNDEGPRPGVLPVYIASAVVGFTFLLMELVWYRMLSPILGGTTYMFGLILAVALFGIGLGGTIAASLRRGVPTVAGFALTCSIEALAIAAPFALGDRLAILANALRELGVAGFSGHVFGWTVVTLIAVFPAAFVAGIQFPLLIALLGRGRDKVAREIGAAYAWNTGGAIAGSLAGGFGLLPLLSAPGTWRGATILLVALAIAAAVMAGRGQRELAVGGTIVIAVAAIACLFAEGPTALWRHSEIGAGRAPHPQRRNDYREWINAARRQLLWDRDGRESSVGVTMPNDLAFVVNGKNDGAARGDAGTQVMLGMAGAVLHPNPRKALVVGLGSGSSAGWLGAIPSMQRVDAVELEPVVVDFARLCDAVNAGALRNPKVKITIADAREVLLTTHEKYDLIASEPSNPYRAGIASLLTREFYGAAANRLNDGGLLLQWVQGYSIQAETMQTIYATLTSVFPHVLTMWTTPGDFVFVASKTPITIDVDALRQRLSQEPYRSAVFNAWRVDSAEGFLGHVVANESYARAAAAGAAALNTDDRSVVEFGFARSVDNAPTVFGEIASSAMRMRATTPENLHGTLDASLIDENRLGRMVGAQSGVPTNPGQRALFALQLATAGDPSAEQHAIAIGHRLPVDATAIVGILRAKQGRIAEATRFLRRALLAYRSTPWPDQEVMRSAIVAATEVAERDPNAARALYDALSKPFSTHQQEMTRRAALLEIAPRFDGCGAATLSALRSAEPNPFWSGELLYLRARCYSETRSPLAAKALDDLAEYREAEPASVIPQSGN